jgi:hypothetical protein
MFLSSGEGKETPTLFGPVDKPVLRLALSKGPNRVSPSLHLKTETNSVSETLFSNSLEFRIMGKNPQMLLILSTLTQNGDVSPSQKKTFNE